jgi:hypothetical protein
VNGARQASVSTHGGSLAVAAAAATAAAVSAAIAAASPNQVLQLAERAAAEAESRWPGQWPPIFAKAIRGVHGDLASLPELRATDVAARCFPNQPLTIVPLALGLATLMQSAEDAILLAANVGGDRIRSLPLRAEFSAAMYPCTVNQHWYEVVERINGHRLAALGSELTMLRH